MQYFLELLEKPYWLNYSPLRMQVHKLVTSKYFDLAISAVIGLNVITMAMEFYMMPDVLLSLHVLVILTLLLQYLDLGLSICNYCFTGIFLCEVILKVFAVGISRYFTDKYRFDNELFQIHIFTLTFSDGTNWI